MSENQHNLEELISPLKTLRIRSGLSQAELARKLSVGGKKVSDRAVRAWEKGDYQPELSIPQTKVLCKVLGVTLDELPDDFGRESQSLTAASLT